MNCSECHKEKELTCCKDCLWNIIMSRIYESQQGDVADRVVRKLEDRLDYLENLVKDKLIVCVKRGDKLKIV